MLFVSHLLKDKCPYDSFQTLSSMPTLVVALRGICNTQITSCTVRAKWKGIQTGFVVTLLAITQTPVVLLCFVCFLF